MVVVPGGDSPGTTTYLTWPPKPAWWRSVADHANLIDAYTAYRSPQTTQWKGPA
jgi:hypothetical protein